MGSAGRCDLSSGSTGTCCRRKNEGRAHPDEGKEERMKGCQDGKEDWTNTIFK